MATPEVLAEKRDLAGINADYKEKFGFNDSDIASQVALQADGKIVVLGTSYYFVPELAYIPTLVRCNADGTLDAADDNGIVVDGQAIAYDDIERARTTFSWGPAPRPGRGTKAKTKQRVR